MKSEYIVCTKEMAVRIFKNRYGLCVSKIENGRFLPFEVLVYDAEYDFCVAKSEKTICIVCQTAQGAIMRIILENGVFKKSIILQSKEKKAQKRYFRLVPVGEFFNLFYVIGKQEGVMLVHQILGNEAGAPEVLDYIKPIGERFFVYSGVLSDITLCYVNKKGVLGTRVFKWSNKSFLPFMPFFSRQNISPAFFSLEENEFFLAALVCEKNYKITFFSKNEIGQIRENTVSELADANSVPVFFREKERIFLEWTYRGELFLAISDDNGETFKKPRQFLKNNMKDVSRLIILSGEKKIVCHANCDDKEVFVYSHPEIVLEMCNYAKRKKAENNIEKIAKSAGIKLAKGTEDDPYVTKSELLSEIKKVFNETEILKKEIKTISEKINSGA